MPAVYVSRAGDKLEYILSQINLDLTNLICVDFGSSAGGFVDCLLRRGIKKIYAVETGYGLLNWKLRTDNKVIVLERTNAMHVTFPEKVDFISIDTSWTKLEHVIPNALNNLKEGGHIVALIKPHYEAKKEMLFKGRLKNEHIFEVLTEVKEKMKKLGLEILFETESPILGEKGKNREFLLFMGKI